MKKFIPIIIVILIFTGIVALTSSNAGKQEDPLVSISYLNDKLYNDIKTDINSAISQGVESAKNSAINHLDNFSGSQDSLLDTSNLADTLYREMYNDEYNGNGMPAEISEGYIIKGAVGTKISISSGNAVVNDGFIIDITNGTEIKKGATLNKNSIYMFAENNSGNVYIKDSSIVVLDGKYRSIKPRIPKYTKYADALYKLGLFKGTNKGYELNRGADRSEGIVFLIRMLGEEEDALNYSGGHPFKDVPEWAYKYVAYAYYKGYTKGISNTEFGASMEMDLNQYLTFILRALEYEEKSGDFSWSNPRDKAIEVGAISRNEAVEMTDNAKLYRDDIVYISYNALNAKIKNKNYILADKLIKNGAISQDIFSQVQNSIK